MPVVIREGYITGLGTWHRSRFPSNQPLRTRTTICSHCVRDLPHSNIIYNKEIKREDKIKKVNNYTQYRFYNSIIVL